ncbi:hypothetical protein PR048_025011, partial [Dryococelus australis]
MERHVKENVPNCIGSVDGKHIRIRSYDYSGSNNFNYVYYFSTVLMAPADADALFVTIDVGAPCRNIDGGVVRASRLGRSLSIAEEYHEAVPSTDLKQHKASLKKTQCAPCNLDVIAQAACVSHNFMRIKDGSMSIPIRNHMLHAMMMIVPVEQMDVTGGRYWQTILYTFHLYRIIGLMWLWNQLRVLTLNSDKQL